MIPMLDLKQQYLVLQEDIDAAVRTVLASGEYCLGRNGSAFEQEAAEYLGVAHAVGVASGTDALHLALRAGGIGPGDEVITTPFTFIATAEAISYTGATPVFVDIDRHFNLDPRQVEAAVTERTRAVIAVHLYGQAADLHEITTICEENDLLLVEDCAQSFGADYRGKQTGSFGAFGCFSFYPTKNLAAFGDGGLIVTNSESHAKDLRTLRNHGAVEPHNHTMIGYNSRLDEIQAAILRIKLKHLDDFNRARRRNAHHYNARLADTGVLVPTEQADRTHVYHQYAIRHTDRNRIREQLAAAGIASAVHYPRPVHKQVAYRDHQKLSLPNAEQAADTVLCLPMYPELAESQIDQVCETIAKAIR